jgi:hypothetical protein
LFCFSENKSGKRLDLTGGKRKTKKYLAFRKWVGGLQRPDFHKEIKL